MLNNSRPPGKSQRPRLVDVFESECCQPSCDRPASKAIATEVPLCEQHIINVYNATHQLMVIQNRDRAPYTLLPSEQEQVPGPCPACGLCGYLTRTVSQLVRCLNASCDYQVAEDEFEAIRRPLLFTAAGNNNVVYYIRFRDLVKIGTTNNLRRRCSEIPVQTLYGFEPGDRTQETRRHRQFAGIRRQGEWFTDGRQIRAHINKVCELAS